MAQLNRQITWAANEGSKSLLALIDEHCHYFNAINVATALHRLSKLHPESQELMAEKTLNRLVLKTTEVLETCDARAISTIAHAAAALNLRDLELATAVVAAALREFEQLDRQGVANLCWALVKLPKVLGRKKLAKRIALKSLDLLKDYTEQELCNVLWALGKLQIRDNKLMSRAAEVSKGRLERFSPQGLSTLAASFARCGVFVESLLEEVREAAEKQLYELNGRDAAQLASGTKLIYQLFHFILVPITFLLCSSIFTYIFSILFCSFLSFPFLSFPFLSFPFLSFPSEVWSHAKFKLCREAFLEKMCGRAEQLDLTEGPLGHRFRAKNEAKRSWCRSCGPSARSAGPLGKHEGCSF